MSVAQEYIKKLNASEKRLERVAMKAIMDNKAFILSYLKHEQLGEGLDSFGRLVGEYAATTEEVYAKMSPRPRTAKVAGANYNFEWTGKFFDGMKIKKQVMGFEIISPTKKLLEDAYDTVLTDFTDENMAFISEKIIEPAIYEDIFSSIGM